MKTGRDITLNGIKYKLDDELHAVHSKSPLEKARAVVADGGEYFSILEDEADAGPEGTAYPVVDNAGSKGVLTGRVIVTLGSDLDAEQVGPAVERLGYARIGGRGRSLVIEKTVGEIVGVVDDAARMQAIEGVDKATPQVIFPKSYR